MAAPKRSIYLLKQGSSQTALQPSSDGAGEARVDQFFDRSLLLCIGLNK